ncbi:delta-like protein 1 [Diadema setosum]|uniref:delta-like protein 1 n=1 Tax=Diadema setosum TaxID=31175 RepID=UPI003B3AE81F
MAAIVMLSQTMIEAVTVVAFRFKRYQNPGHHDSGNECCDPQPWLFWDPCNDCDNRFIVCFDTVSNDLNLHPCTYGSFSTNRLIADDDDFYFPSPLAPLDENDDDIPNPYYFTTSNWQDGFRVKIQVWDYDPTNADDLVDELGFNFVGSQYQPAANEGAATTWNEEILHDGQQSTYVITVEVKIYCEDHYYGPENGCATYCLPRDDDLGHYDCDSVTGSKVCHPGYVGENCEQITTSS